MIYRGPGLIAVLTHGLHLSPITIDVTLFQSSCVSPVELADGRGGGGGAESYGREEAWSSINHSILSG